MIYTIIEYIPSLIHHLHHQVITSIHQEATIIRLAQFAFKDD